MVQLFRAFSVRENYKGRDSVVIYWFCHEREEPTAPYETLVKNYSALSEDERLLCKRKIDNFLTVSEIKELGVYLDSYFAQDVRSAEVSLPFESSGSIPDISAHTCEGEYFYLYKNKGYPLAVPVSGFVDLSEPPNLVSYRDS